MGHYIAGIVALDSIVVNIVGGIVDWGVVVQLSLFDHKKLS